MFGPHLPMSSLVREISDLSNIFNLNCTSSKIRSRPIFCPKCLSVWFSVQHFLWTLKQNESCYLYLRNYIANEENFNIKPAIIRRSKVLCDILALSQQKIVYSIKTVHICLKWHLFLSRQFPYEASACIINNNNENNEIL